VPKQWALHQARSALYGGGGGVAKVGGAHALIAPGFFAVDPGSNPPLFCHTLSWNTISSAYYTIQPQLHDPTLLIHHPTLLMHDPTLALPVLDTVALSWLESSLLSRPGQLTNKTLHTEHVVCRPLSCAISRDRFEWMNAISTDASGATEPRGDDRSTDTQGRSRADTQDRCLSRPFSNLKSSILAAAAAGSQDGLSQASS